MEVVDLPVGKLKRYTNNPRHNSQAVATVKKSLDAFGWRQPIVVDEDYVIVVGDTRYLAALERGETHVPVHIANLTPEQARAYRIADNRVGEESQWDDTKLVMELEALSKAQFDMGSLGFSHEELRLMLAPPEDDAREFEDFDVTPKPKPMWIMISTNVSEGARIMAAIQKLELTEATRVEQTGQRKR